MTHPAKLRLGLSLRPSELGAPLMEAVHGVVEIIADQWLFACDEALEPLVALRRDRSMVLHCLGLNLASCDGLDPEYVDRVARLADRLEVRTVSDHSRGEASMASGARRSCPCPFEPTFCTTPRPEFTPFRSDWVGR